MNLSNLQAPHAAFVQCYPATLTSFLLKNIFVLDHYPFLLFPLFGINAIKQEELYQQFQHKQMSTAQDNNLLGFLKQKTLFKPPQTKPNPRRQRSKSRDGKDSIIGKINDKDLELEPRNNVFYQNNSEFEYRKDPMSVGNFLQKSSQPFVEENQLKRDKIPFNPQPNFLQKSKNPQDKFDFGTLDKGNKFLNGLASYSTSFQSARLQSAQCLESLSGKLNSEIKNITNRIDEFRNNMSKVLHNELKALKDQILQLVDEAFKESERSIRDYMKIEEQKLAGEVFKVKENLEKEYLRIEGMKEEIKGPQWRKVAGEVLATELEKTMQDTVKKAGFVSIGRWEMKNLSGQRLKTLQVELRDLVRLKE